VLVVRTVLLSVTIDRWQSAAAAAGCNST